MILKEIIKKTNLISNRVVIEETNCIQLLYKSRLTIIGGFTGLISANSIIDTILHDSYFIIGILKEDGLLVIPGRVNSAVTFRLLNKGEFLGIIMDDMIIIIIDYFSLVCLFFYLIPLNTLLWSLFKAIVLNDIKSIIALSTISQISYMFIALLINLILCFYHIMIQLLWYWSFSSISIS